MSLLILHPYIFIEQTDCILLLLLGLNTILLTSSVEILCFSLRNLGSDFNINILSFKQS